MSLRKAINEKCRDCIYDPLSGLGHWRQQVEACLIASCSLHRVRPRSSPKRCSSANSVVIETELGEAV